MEIRFYVFKFLNMIPANTFEIQVLEDQTTLIIHTLIPDMLYLKSLLHHIFAAANRKQVKPLRPSIKK